MWKELKAAPVERAPEEVGCALQNMRLTALIGKAWRAHGWGTHLCLQEVACSRSAGMGSALHTGLSPDTSVGREPRSLAVALSFLPVRPRGPQSCFQMLPRLPSSCTCCASSLAPEGCSRASPAARRSGRHLLPPLWLLQLPSIVHACPRPPPEQQLLRASSRALAGLPRNRPGCNRQWQCAGPCSGGASDGGGWRACSPAPRTWCWTMCVAGLTTGQ